MCLIVFAWRTHPRYRLILAANRDEYFGRPTAPATFWDDHPGVLAGRDLEAGGTWLGITPQGRFARRARERFPHGRGDAGEISRRDRKTRQGLQRLQPARRRRGVAVLLLQPRRPRGARRAGRARPVEPSARYALAQGRKRQGRFFGSARQALRRRGGVASARRHATRLR